MQKLGSILLMLLFCFPLWAQDTQTVAERNAAQGFNDSIDRLVRCHIHHQLPTTCHRFLIGS